MMAAALIEELGVAKTSLEDAAGALRQAHEALDDGPLRSLIAKTVFNVNDSINTAACTLAGQNEDLSQQPVLSRTRCKVSPRFGTPFDLDQAEDHAWFIASSLQALFVAMPEGGIDDDVAAKFIVRHLGNLAEQLALALGGGDGVLIGEKAEANHD